MPPVTVMLTDLATPFGEPFTPAASENVIVAVPGWFVLLKLNVALPPLSVFVACAPPLPLTPAPVTEPIVDGDSEALIVVPSDSGVPSFFCTDTVMAVKEFVEIDVDEGLIVMVSGPVGVKAE